MDSILNEPRRFYDESRKTTSMKVGEGGAKNETGNQHSKEALTT